MIEAGTLLQDRYRIEKQIGQGGMGAVYVAVDERFGSVVAIKETLFADANFSKAFEREARLLNNLRHSALPRVSDHFSDDHGQFIVMEYIDGEDLSAMMEKKESAFPLKDVLNWADQLLDALDYLHTQEIPVVHRDIKPQNLKLTPRGQIILLDFGLAKGNPTDAKNLTATKSVFGYSRNYASIEQMQGTGTDPRSDLYSLGATLYHLVTGVPPVDALTRAMKVLNGDSDPLPMANTVHQQVPFAVADILHKAMALNSNHRPTSALAMRTILAEAANSVSDQVSATSANLSAGNILTQNTQVFDSSSGAKDTKYGLAETELITNGIVSAQTELLGENQLETETSVRLGNKNLKANIAVPLSSSNQTSPLLQTSGTVRRRLYLAAAAGIFLLGGIAVGGIYLVKPDIFAQGAESATTNVSAENDQTEQKNPGVNEKADNPANITSPAPDLNIAESQTETTASKKPAEKKIVENQTPKPPVQESKENAKKEEAPLDKTGKKVLVMDDEGNKLYEDGTIRASDGTTVYPDGRIVKDGKVIAKPNFNIKVKPSTPPVRIPPLTREQIEQLSPEQRRKLREIVEKQRRQDENRKNREDPDNQ